MEHWQTMQPRAKRQFPVPLLYHLSHRYRHSDHVPYRNSKLTRMLQPSLSGNARISVICTINPDAGAVSESMNTLLFAKRIKNVQVRLLL